jgi:hypothetical protein
MLINLEQQRTEPERQTNKDRERFTEKKKKGNNTQNPNQIIFY